MLNRSFEKDARKSRGWRGALVAMFIVGGLTLNACGSSQKLAASPDAQEARGTVTQQLEANGTRVSIHVRNLPQPGRVGPDAKAYVAWAQPSSGGQPRRLGVLQLDGDEGNLETDTPLKSFQVFITAEPSTTNTTPWGEKLLWTEIGENKS
jgi:hypothetical protein